MMAAMTITPALKLTLLGKAKYAGRETPLAPLLRKPYIAALKATEPRPVWVSVGVAAFLIIGFAVSPLLGESLIPRLQEREIVVDWNTVPGTSIAETYRITERVSRELRELPGVNNVAALIGRAVTGDRVVGVNSSQIWVSIYPGTTYADTLQSVREVLNGYPGVQHNIQTYLRNRVSEALTGESDSIVVRVFGPDRAVLQGQADAVRRALSVIDGLEDLRAEYQVEEPHVELSIDLDAAGALGVKPGEVRRSSATIFSGIVVGYLFKEQKIFEVVVWGAPQIRQSLTDLLNLRVEKSDRSSVLLHEVADVSIQPTETVIRHESTAPYIDVVANVAERDYVSVAEEVKDRLQAMEFPLEYHPELLGEYAEWENAEDRVFAASIAALIGIFLLLQACFRSWPLAVVGLLAIPVSVMGGVLATLASDGLVSLGSIVGFFAVVGIATRNSVLLIHHYQYLEEHEGMTFNRELILKGASDRLLPCIASSLAILGVLSPFIVLGPIAGLEIVQPMAVVVSGGLLAARTVYALCNAGILRSYSKAFRQEAGAGYLSGLKQVIS